MPSGHDSCEVETGCGDATKKEVDPFALLELGPLAVDAVVVE